MRQAVIWVILDHATPFSNDNNYVLKTSVGCARSLSLPRTLLSDQCLFLSPSPSLAPSLTLCGWTRTSSVVDAGSFAAWRRSAAPSEHSRPLHNHLTAAESKGSGCPDAGVDCSHLTSAVLVWCKCVSAMRRMEEHLFCLRSPVLGSEGRKFVFTYPSGFSSRLAGDPTISPRVQKV